MAKQTHDRLTEAILETADGLRRVGVIDAVTHEKITRRHLDEKAPASEQNTNGKTPTSTSPRPLASVPR